MVLLLNEYDSTCHKCILLMKIWFCTYKTLGAFKNELFICCAIALPRIIYSCSTHSRNLLLSNNYPGILHVAKNRLEEYREFLNFIII